MQETAIFVNENLKEITGIEYDFKMDHDQYWYWETIHKILVRRQESVVCLHRFIPGLPWVAHRSSFYLPPKKCIGNCKLQNLSVLLGTSFCMYEIIYSRKTFKSIQHLKGRRYQLPRIIKIQEVSLSGINDNPNYSKPNQKAYSIQKAKKV